jgi:mandelate racemase
MSREETKMSAGPSIIRGTTARAIDAPISRPVKQAFGIIRSAPPVLIDVGIAGRA